MLANEAPKKIYFTANENGTHYYTEGIPFEREYIEFVQVDAFIKKARKYLSKTLVDNCGFDTITLNEYIEDFIKTMEE
jgi:hypothetical protein